VNGGSNLTLNKEDKKNKINGIHNQSQNCQIIDAVCDTIEQNLGNLNSNRGSDTNENKRKRESKIDQMIILLKQMKEWD